MGKILVIAEKPSLGRSIAGAISWWKGEKFERQGKDRNTWLESDNYIVVSLVGHLYELIDFDAYFPGYDPAVKQPWDLKKLPFFPDDWKFKFEGKEKVQGLIKVANQQMNRKDVDAIYNAGDPDREGQRLVDEVLLYGLKAPKTIYRLWLPDTTNKTIKQAFETAKPNAGYVSLSSSAETRSEIDWLLGIELTRYVSIKAGGFTRIGRCVCPIVQHIIEREKAIKEFVPKPYSAVSSKEKTNGEEIELTSKRTFEEGHEAEAQALADAFNKAGATVTNIKTERKTVNPGKLFSMSDLQSFACKADKTLSPADVLAATQALYEGGYVTYPRTNSSYLATNETVKVDAAIRGLAQNGITGLVNKPKLKSIYDDSKIEAHSAITPTGKWPASLTGTQKTVFDCILNRFCAVFCEEACTVIYGTFKVMNLKATNQSKIPSFKSTRKFVGAFADKNRVLSEEEKGLVPQIGDDYILPKEVVAVCHLIAETRGSKRSMTNVMLRGDPSVGKTAGARAIAAGLGLPYTFITCNAGTEMYNFIGDMMPVDSSATSESINAELFKNLPSATDISIDPVNAYMAITGVSKPDATEAECMTELFRKQLSLCADACKNGFKYVESPLVRAIRNGWVCELQEPSLITRPAVMPGLNGLLDETGCVVLPTGEMLHRHPDCIIISTLNIDLEGCRPLNQSFIDRHHIIMDMVTPSEAVIESRIRGMTGCDDTVPLKQMIAFVKEIAEICARFGATDGNVNSMRSLANWVQAGSITGDYATAATWTVISGATSDLATREELVRKLANYQF